MAGEGVAADIAANINPFTEIKVETMATGRGPRPLMAGEKDHTLPLSVIRADFKKQKRNTSATTEQQELPNGVTR